VTHAADSGVFGKRTERCRFGVRGVIFSPGDSDADQVI
jgi:hypothetical protein